MEKIIIEFQGKKIEVESLSSGNKITYKVNFHDRPSLTILRHVDSHNNPDWISIPEGNDLLAQELGDLIENEMK
ncbi:hypothetical protein [Ferruginibacter albus]|uniref:hypothetical protein n=1 Tax=Ferruginibacter albus TaxID=2875540 RepID=UPI001CC6AAB7|nr:hypothetical protein [Ferruginibacter albus]UAY51236.1 hypothetical protein K9M53_11620 [Ferruginibacter albus]